MKKSSVPVSMNKQLLSEWDWEMNNSISLFPEKVSVGSQKKAYWKCQKHGKSYMQIIRDRKKGKVGCELCKKEISNSRPRDRYIADKLVLAETHPDLVKEWYSCDNSKFTPYNTVASSNVLVKWKCSRCGGIYESYTYNRARNNTGCPYCSGQKVLPGFNDLCTVNPQLASEWSERNSFSPNEVTSKSNIKVFWRCPMGHKDYLATVKNRSYGQGCPVCALRQQTSFPEQAIFFYVKKAYPDAINRFVVENNEIDIFIPSINTGIEYNGYYYHKGKTEKDEKKRILLESIGIKLLTVKEFKHQSECFGADYYIKDICKNEDLNSIIKLILHDIGLKKNIVVNCDLDQIKIREQYIISKKENSIAEHSPSLLLEWDYDKNGSIKPEFISFGSNQKYYWICSKCSSSYVASPKSRSRGTGCPYCAGKKVRKGYNDLKTKYPDIAKEWDYEMNGDLLPESVSFGMSKKVWWKCSKGHSWQKSINQRTFGGFGCPYCSGRKVLAGFNDLLSLDPQKAKDWDFDSNSLNPDQIHYNNQTIPIHWICSKCGFKWVSVVGKKKDCPNCRKNKRKINVYSAEDLSFITSFKSARELCLYFGWDYDKEHSSISSICNRKQKTFKGKYILRHADDDEFANK